MQRNFHLFVEIISFLREKKMTQSYELLRLV